jgi:hypothetical protein
MKYLIKSIEIDLENLNVKIEDLSDYIEINQTEDENLLKQQLFQMLQYRDTLKQRLNKLK